MKIAVDCRYIGKSGIGRVCEGLIDNLDYINDTIYLIGNPSKLQKYDKAKIIEDMTEPYSVKGLLNFNHKKVNKECDCIILPNFLIPFGIKVPIYSVMHDLIFLDVKETTNGRIDYTIKKFLLKRCMKKSKSIACVSQFTLSRCQYHFNKYADKCYVNYNGLSKDIIEYKKLGSKPQKTNDIVFVGNIKRHKGLTTLLEAFSKLSDNNTKLKIIGERDGFITGLKLDENAYKNVEFTGKLSNSELYSEIENAKFLVQPSIYEGFGLPPLEALYLGTQPIISDIEVFREIYKDLPVIYFNGVDDLVEKMQSNPARVDCGDLINIRYNYINFEKNIISKTM